MAKKIILCDMDGIIVDFTGEIIRKINKKYNANLRRSDINTWDFKDCVPKEYGSPWQFANQDGFYENLKPLAGAIAALAQLHDAGLEIVISTSPSKNPNSAAEKKRWVARHLPFVNENQVMVGSMKHLLKGDFFIDDAPKNQKKYREAWPDTPILTIKYPFDADEGVTVEAEGYQDTDNAWRVIVREILARAA